MKRVPTAVLALMCVAAADVVQPTTATADRPNILFIMSDDHAAHAISAYGSRVNQTPHLDRLAKEGALLTTRLRHQLDLHAEPRGDPHRPVLAPERRDRVQPLRQLAADRRDAAPGRAAITPA